MGSVNVTHQDADRFELEVRGHRLVCDQPLADGGDDLGPTPTELFVASLAACVGFYARRYLARHGLPGDGLRIDGEFTMSAGHPARVESITLRLVTPEPLPDNRRKALLAVVDHCTVHNSIRVPPDVRIALGSGGSWSAAMAPGSNGAEPAGAAGGARQAPPPRR